MNELGNQMQERGSVSWGSLSNQQQHTVTANFVPFIEECYPNHLMNGKNCQWWARQLWMIHHTQTLIPCGSELLAVDGFHVKPSPETFSNIVGALAPHFCELGEN